MIGWSLRSAQDAREGLRIVLAELEGAACRLGIEHLDGWEGNAAQGARSRLAELRMMLDSAQSQAETALYEAEARLRFVEDSLAAVAAGGMPEAGAVSRAGAGESALATRAGR